MSKVRLGLLGATGRMGCAVTELVESEYRDRSELVATPHSNRSDLDDLGRADVVVDFSLPAGTEALTAWLQAHPRRTPALVCGTTGHTDEQFRHLQRLGDTRRVLHASNFSVGVSALEALLEFASPLLNSLGYTPLVTETHHGDKRDAPSGTAKVLQRILQPTAPDAVQTHSLRGGRVIGEHEIRFLGTDDEISVRHIAQNRLLFARGALEAALWLTEHADGPGFMTMRDYFRARFSTVEPS